MLVQMFSWQKQSVGIPRAGLSKLLLRKLKTRVCPLEMKTFPFSHSTSTHLKFCFGLTQLSVSLLFLLNKMFCHLWCLRNQKWKPTYFTLESVGKDVSSHLNSSSISFSELTCLMNTAQVGKRLLSATGHFHQQINSSREFAKSVWESWLACCFCPDS